MKKKNILNVKTIALFLDNKVVVKSVTISESIRGV